MNTLFKLAVFPASGRILLGRLYSVGSVGTMSAIPQVDLDIFSKVKR